MSDILLAQLSEIYPPVGPHNATQLSTYPFSEMGGKYIERIYLDVNETRFYDNDEPLITLDEIKTLANNIFDDINCRLKLNSDKDYELFFKPQDPTPYIFNYDEHKIIIKKPFNTLQLNVETGSRGSIGLNDRQREKYFNFVNGLYDIFVENLEKINS